MLVAGVDCSTQATKVAVVDVDDGRIVAAGTAPHLVTGTDGARETDPRLWDDALAAALTATGLAREVGAISVAAQQHGLVVLDAAGAPLRPAVLWNDTRAAPDAAALVDALGGPEPWAEKVGSVPVASFTVAKWAWLRRTEPAVADAAAAVVLPHDYVTGRLTGERTTDRGDASGTGWWSAPAGEYLPEVLDLPSLRLGPELLPRVTSPRQAAGEVTAAAAARYGLTAGIPVGPGTGDNMAAALGLGVPSGTPVMSLGTSGTAYAVMSAPAADPTGTVAGFADATGRYLPLACTLNATLAVDRIAAWLGLDRDDVADATDVVVLPYLDGERTPNLPGASGAIVGLRHDTTPQQVLRAAYEGAVASLLDAMDVIAAQGSGIEPDAPLVLVGGGARGRAWRDVVACLACRALEVPRTDEHVAVGAAVQAAAVATGETPDAVTARWGHGQGDVVPVPPAREGALERIRAVRRQLYGV